LTVSATIVEDFTSMTAEELANSAKIEFKDGKTYNFGKMAQSSKVEHDHAEDAKKTTSTSNKIITQEGSLKIADLV
jgi:hypothetical protein